MQAMLLCCALKMLAKLCAIVKLRKKQLDSLIFTSVAKGNLEMNDTLKFSSNNPIISLDTSKIIFTDKDTLKVKMNAIISKKENNVIFLE